MHRPSTTLQGVDSKPHHIRVRSSSQPAAEAIDMASAYSPPRPPSPPPGRRGRHHGSRRASSSSIPSSPLMINRNMAAVPTTNVFVDDEIRVSSLPSFQKRREQQQFAEAHVMEEVHHVAEYTEIGSHQHHHQQHHDPHMISNSSDTMRRSMVKSQSSIMREQEAHQLIDMGFPRGLALQLGKNTRSVFPVRFWILDNSGSMMENDGTCIRGNSTVPCTRWAELQETVNYHATLAGVIQATSVFRFLNDPGARCGNPEFTIGDGGKFQEDEVENAKRTMRLCQPSGPTPMTAHVIEIGERVAAMKDEMIRKGLQAVLILATDGLPTSSIGLTNNETNEEFINALREIQQLPIWLVIRLCTDDKEVVDFYNGLDKILELNLEVLDDFIDEAKEIHRYNKWLNYSIPIHRCREIGYQNRVFDLLDERPLNKDEVMDLCVMLFGKAFEKAPNIHDEWEEFLKVLGRFLDREKPHFNPVTRKVEPLINVKKLRGHFRKGILCKLKR